MNPSDNEEFKAANATNDAIYMELARANLLRMRGDYAGAIQECRSVLSVSPDNAAASGLLGDIAAEQGELELAVQYYDLALDADRLAPGLEAKLENVQLRITERDSASSAEQIGLPSRSGPNVWLLAGVIGIVALLAAIGFVLNQSKSREAVALPLPDIQAPLQAGSSQNAPSTKSDPATNPRNSTETIQNTVAANANPSLPSGAIDPDLADAVSKATGPLAKISAAEYDPRRFMVTVTAPLPPGEEPRNYAAELAKAALDAWAYAKAVTVRIVDKSGVAYVADASRPAPTANGDGSTGTSSILPGLTNEWTRPASADSAGAKVPDQASGSPVKP